MQRYLPNLNFLFAYLFYPPKWILSCNKSDALDRQATFKDKKVTLTEQLDSPKRTSGGLVLIGWLSYFRATRLVKSENKYEGLVSKETAVLRRRGVETNVWFINSIDN